MKEVEDLIEIAMLSDLSGGEESTTGGYGSYPSYIEEQQQQEAVLNPLEFYSMTEEEVARLEEREIDEMIGMLMQEMADIEANRYYGPRGPYLCQRS